MSAQTPTIREELGALAQLQRFAIYLQTLGFGDLVAAFVRKCLGGSRVQSASFTASGTSQALTFAGLGLAPPASTAYQVFAACNTTNARVTENTKTLTGFTLVGLTNAEVVNVAIVEDTGDGSERVTVTSNAATLAAQAAVLLDVLVTSVSSGTALGRKALKIGDSSVVPGPGEVVWDGASGLRFSPADAVTGARVLSLPAASPLTISLLNRQVGQRD